MKLVLFAFMFEFNVFDDIIIRANMFRNFEFYATNIFYLNWLKMVNYGVGI